MDREVWEVQERCEKCGTIRRALVHETGLADDGEPYEAVYVDRTPHGQRDCEAFQRLYKETWPTLW